MKQTSEAAIETAIEAVLLNDRCSKLPSGVFAPSRANQNQGAVPVANFQDSKFAHTECARQGGAQGGAP